MHNMNDEQKGRLRERMITNKSFLQQIYQANRLQAKDLLSFADLKQLKLLIEICHYVATGVIPLAQDQYDEIVKLRKLSLIRKSLENKANIKVLLKSNRQQILQFLYKLCPVLKHLLWAILNRKLEK